MTATEQEKAGQQPQHPGIVPARNPNDKHNTNPSQTVPRDGRGQPVTDDEEEVETPLTDEALANEGDPEAGKYTKQELAEQLRPRAIPIRDRRAYLVDQAARNEAANDEVNRKECEAINQGRKNMALVDDPDKTREEGLESALADIEMHTEEGREKRAQARQAIAEARKEQGNPSAVPGDISGGSGGGDRPENKGEPDKGTKDKDKDKDKDKEPKK